MTPQVKQNWLLGYHYHQYPIVICEMTSFARRPISIVNQNATRKMDCEFHFLSRGFELFVFTRSRLQEHWLPFYTGRYHHTRQIYSFQRQNWSYYSVSYHQCLTHNWQSKAEPLSSAYCATSMGPSFLFATSVEPGLTSLTPGSYIL